MKEPRLISPTKELDTMEGFSRRGWLSSATPKLRSQMLAAGRRVCLDRGEYLFSAGAQPGGIYGVVTGGVGAEGSTQFHTPKLGHVFRSGHWFGHGPALHGGLRTMGYFAVENSVLLTITLEDLQQLMRQDAEISRQVGRMANIGTDIASWVALDLLIPDAPRRIAAVLLRVTGALEAVEPSDARGFQLTQAEIGVMANVSRVYLNRVLSSFTKSGWIATTYGYLRLLDVNALTDFAYSTDED